MERVNQRENHLLGSNMRRLREAKGLRNRDVLVQLQLRGIDIARSTYSKMELGINNPTVDVLIALTEILGCDFNALFAQNKD